MMQKMSSPSHTGAAYDQRCAEVKQSVQSRRMNTSTPHEAERWHLKKEIQLGHLITTATVAVSAILYIAKVEQRVAVIEAQIVAQHERDKVLEERTAEAMRVTRAQLDRIDSKIDRLVENQRR